MNWGKYAGLFGIGMVKFMVAPFGGRPLKLSFFETYLACVAGAVLSAAIFYFLSEFLLKRSALKREKLRKDAKKNGVKLTVKKNFTFMNKLIIRIKRLFGIYGICFFAPLILSIPIGTIITAKFYGKEKRTFPLILMGIFVNGFVLTSLAYMKYIINYFSA